MSQPSVSRRTVTVNGEHGLHLVPCSLIAKAAAGFRCEIVVMKDAQAANAKTVLELMTLNAGQGSALVIEARGDGADEAVTAIEELFQSNFAVEPSSEPPEETT